MRHIFLFVILFCGYSVCFSQDYRFHHLTTVDGLSHNEVRKIVKDTEGFMWFGTQNGLNRFDGYRFKVFKHTPNDSTSLVDDKIYALAASKNKLWVGTTNGISILDTRTLKVVHTPKIAKMLFGHTIFQLYNDGEGKIWVATGDKNYIIDVTTLEINSCLTSYKLVCLAMGGDGYFWIGTDKGLLKYDTERDTVIKEYDVGSYNIFSPNQIYTNTLGEVWTTVGHDVYVYESERDRFVRVHRSRRLNAVAENSNGTVFFGSYGGGLLEYERSTGVFTAVSAHPDKHYSLSSDDVYDVFIDEEDIVWVGTQEGLDYYDRTRHRFKSLVHGPAVDHNLRSSFVQSLSGISIDTLWVGTREGIDEVSFATEYSDAKVVPIELSESSLEVLSGKYINCIYQDSKNRVWIGTASDGLFLYQRKAGTMEHFVNKLGDSVSLASNAALSVMEDHSGRIWVGTSAGLSCLKEGGEKGYVFENYIFSEENGQKIPLNDIYSIFQDSKKRIWLGMYMGGVALLQERNGKMNFHRFLNDPQNPKSLSNNEVFVIFEDSRQQVWFGTSAGGLNKLCGDIPHIEIQGYYFDRYTEMEGLSDNEVNAILEDDSGYLWVATNMGLSKFDTKAEKFTNYSTYDGTLKGKFRKNARWKTEDGTLFFGGTAGINYFNPNNFSENKKLPAPMVTNFMIDGKEIKLGDELNGTVVVSSPLSTGQSITLPFRNNRFEIELAAGTYSSPFRNLYAYKLEGLDAQWKIISGDDPRVEYPHLPPGSFRLLIRAANNDGLWNTDPVYLDIKVKSDFLGSYASRIGLAFFAFITLVIWLSFKLFVKGKRKRKPYRDSDPLTELENQKKIEALESFMKIESPYLDPELDLAVLAAKINVTPNHLTILLNEYIGKNFYDYVNGYRVDEVKKRLVDPKYKNHTISSIGGDCGFNSKSSFNRVFKKTTGKTPSQFRRIIDSKSLV